MAIGHRPDQRLVERQRAVTAVQHDEVVADAMHLGEAEGSRCVSLSAVSAGSSHVVRGRRRWCGGRSSRRGRRWLGRQHQTGPCCRSRTGWRQSVQAAQQQAHDAWRLPGKRCASIAGTSAVCPIAAVDLSRQAVLLPSLRRRGHAAPENRLNWEHLLALPSTLILIIAGVLLLLALAAAVGTRRHWRSAARLRGACICCWPWSGWRWRCCRPAWAGACVVIASLPPRCRW